MGIQFATVTGISGSKVKVQFNQDGAPSALEYFKLKSYTPTVGDRVLMLSTNTSFVCLGAIG